MAKNILFVLLEFDNWQRGRGWSYTGSYAFINGFARNGHRCFVLPALFGRDPAAADSFIKHAPKLFAGQQFDEAWIWTNHSSYDENFWSWLKEVAPVRVGVALESLNYTPFEHEALPFLKEWMESGYASLPHCTHAIVPDEMDVPEIESRFGIPAAQNIFMIPEELVRNDPAPEREIASFIGSTYFTGPGYDLPKAALLPRNLYLADSRLHGLMDRPHFQLPERKSDTLARFETIHKVSTPMSRNCRNCAASFLPCCSTAIGSEWPTSTCRRWSNPIPAASSKPWRPACPASAGASPIAPNVPNGSRKMRNWCCSTRSRNWHKNSSACATNPIGGSTSSLTDARLFLNATRAASVAGNTATGWTTAPVFTELNR